MKLRLSKEKRQIEARESRDRRLWWENKADFSSFTGNLKNFDLLWGMKVGRDNKPWDHASEFNPPLIYSKIEDVHATVYGFVANLDFFKIAASAKKGMAQEVMRDRADLLDGHTKWSLRTECNASAFLDQFAHDGIKYGSAFGELLWSRDSRSIQAEYFVPDEIRESGSKDDRAIIKAALGPALLSTNLKKVGKSGKFSFRMLDEDGSEKPAIGWVDRENPFRGEDEISVIIEREQVYRNAPIPSRIMPWDILVPEDAQSLQTARRYWVRKHMTLDDIKRQQKNGMFNALTLDDIKEIEKKFYPKDISGRPTLTPEVSTQTHEPYDDPNSREDTDRGGNKLESRKDTFEVFYEYAFEDVNGDGLDESIVRAVIETPDPFLAMRHRMEYLCPHGRRPHFDWHFVPVSDRFHGMGLAEVLEPMQTEENAYYQSRSDVLEIITKPGGFYDPMSGLAPDAIRYTPGMMIKASLDRPPFQPLVFPVDPGHLIREQSGIELQAERATGVTDMGLGRGPTRPNSPRTLGGTAIMVRQQQLRGNVVLNRFILGRSWPYTSGVSEFLSQYLDLTMAFMPKEKEFRALGSDEIRTISRADIQGRWDFVVDMSEDVNNPQLKLQNRLMIHDRALSNPIVAQDRDALYEITVQFWEAAGLKNARRILRKPEGFQARPQMEPDEILTVLAKGIAIEPLPQEDHAAMITAITEMIQNPQELAARGFNTTNMPLLENYAQKTMEFLSAGANGVPSPGGDNGVSRGGDRPAGVNMQQEQVAGPIDNSAGGEF